MPEPLTFEKEPDTPILHTGKVNDLGIGVERGSELLRAAKAQGMLLAHGIPRRSCQDADRAT